MTKEELLKMISDGNSADAGFFLTDLGNQEDIDEVRLAIIEDMSFLPLWDELDTDIFLTHCNKLTSIELRDKFIRSNVPRMYNYMNLKEIAEMAFDRIENKDLIIEIFFEMMEMEIDDAGTKQAKNEIFEKFVEVLKNSNHAIADKFVRKFGSQ